MDPEVASNPTGLLVTELVILFALCDLSEDTKLLKSTTNTAKDRLRITIGCLAHRFVIRLHAFFRNQRNN